MANPPEAPPSAMRSVGWALGRAAKYHFVDANTEIVLVLASEVIRQRALIDECLKFMEGEYCEDAKDYFTLLTKLKGEKR